MTLAKIIPEEAYRWPRVDLNQPGDHLVYLMAHDVVGLRDREWRVPRTRPYAISEIRAGLGLPPR